MKPSDIICDVKTQIFKEKWSNMFTMAICSEDLEANFYKANAMDF